MNTDTAKITAPEQNFTIFISHPREDAVIAQALQNALVDLDRLRVDVFVDQAAIPKGGKIGSYITASLDRANWFIAVGPDAVRSNFSWCGLELGYFLGVQEKESEAQSGAPSRFLTLLYHAEIHELFKDRNNTKVLPLEERHKSELPGEVSLVGECPLFKLFMDVAQSYVDFYSRASKQDIDLGERFRDWAEKAACSVTNSYYESLRQRVKDIWYPQNRLEIRVKNGDFWNNEDKGIPLESEVELDIPTYALFRLAAPAGTTREPLNWAGFSEIIRLQCGSEGLLTLIREVLCSVLPLGADAANDYTFIAPNGLRYRVLLVKHQRYGTNRRDFVINLVPTIRRDAGGSEATTQLTAAIMMASKYWFMFLEEGSNYSVDAFRRANTTGSFVSLMRKMLRDLDRVSLEATDDGLADKQVLIELLGNADEVAEMFKTWWPAMDRLREAAEEVTARSEDSYLTFIERLKEFIDVSKTLNRGFIQLCLDVYKSRLEQSI